MRCEIHNNYNYHFRGQPWDLKPEYNKPPKFRHKHETDFHIYCDGIFHIWFALDEKGIELHDHDRVSKCYQK